MPSPHLPYSYKNSVKSDISDELINVYLQRPLAGLVARCVYPTRITPNQLTLIGTLIGIAGGFLLGEQNAHLPAAALCFYVKDIFDSADGQLARAKQLYSRRGRFLDSIGDFVVDVFLFGGIGSYLLRDGVSVAAALLVSVAGVLGVSLRVSYHVFYQTSYLHQEKRYGTNRMTEELRGEDYLEGGLTIRLQKIFQFLYGWQDQAMARLDAWCLRERKGEDTDARWFQDRTGLLLGGFLGFGTEFVLLTACLLLGSVQLYLFITIGLLNCVWLSAILYRKMFLGVKISAETMKEE